ncbi:hypothetical protein PHMEG_00035680, partial [Phytophthora megakarya]
LRMAAKILQRSIFVVLARNRWDNASYQIFEPAEVKMGGGGNQVSSRKEHNFPMGKPKSWIKTLQKHCKNAASTGKNPGNNPIVLQYAGDHYTWLQFVDQHDLIENDEIINDTLDIVPETPESNPTASPRNEMKGIQSQRRWI